MFGPSRSLHLAIGAVRRIDPPPGACADGTQRLEARNVTARIQKQELLFLRRRFRLRFRLRFAFARDAFRGRFFRALARAARVDPVMTRSAYIHMNETARRIKADAGRAEALRV